MNNKIVIGLPAYNEGVSIEKLLNRIVDLYENNNNIIVVVVNDGSTDSTEDILKTFSNDYNFIEYINHPKNLGLGKAVETVFNHVINNYSDEDILVTLDSDNTHNPDIIPNMAKLLKDEDLDLVIASRFVEGGKEIGLSFFRKVMSRGASLYCRTIFPLESIKDYSCGFRAYNVSYLKKAQKMYGGNLVSASGFECMVEILGRFSKIGVKAKEYPLVLEYNLKESPSKMKVLKTIKGYFNLFFKIKKPVEKESI